MWAARLLGFTAFGLNDLLSKLNAGELVRALIEEVGIIDYYRNSSVHDDLDRYENVLEFLKSVDEFMIRESDGGLTEFLEEVSLLTDLDQWNDEANRVTLMTVHAAKGLEFPVVFMTGLEDGLFPLYSSLELQEKLKKIKDVPEKGPKNVTNALFVGSTTELTKLLKNKK